MVQSRLDEKLYRDEITLSKFVFTFLLKLIRGAASLYTQGLSLDTGSSFHFQLLPDCFQGKRSENSFRLLSRSEQTNDAAYLTGDEEKKQNVTIKSSALTRLGLDLFCGPRGLVRSTLSFR